MKDFALLLQTVFNAIYARNEIKGEITMTQEDKDLLLSLILKADENGLLQIYDEEENYHEAEWIFFDGDKLCIKIN